MKNIMKTYNFLVIIGKTQFQIDINAYTENEALTIMEKEYPRSDGCFYILI